MRKYLYFFICIFALTPVAVFAQDEESAETATETSWKQEMASDRAALKEQKTAIDSHAQEARQEEESLRSQIRQARESGDVETANQLREQLRAMHDENMQQRQADTQGLKETRDQMHEQIREAKAEGRPSLNPPSGNQGQTMNPPAMNSPQGSANSPKAWGKPLPVPPADAKAQADRQRDLRDRDRREDMRDRREDAADRREDVRDRREDVRDRQEDMRDRREDRWDATHNAPVGTEAWKRDKMEDVRDRREDVRDRKEDVRDRRENKGDRREDKADRKEDIRDRKNQKGMDMARKDQKVKPGNQGVRDHGAGVGAGKGQGGVNRSFSGIGKAQGGSRASAGGAAKGGKRR